MFIVVSIVVLILILGLPSYVWWLYSGIWNLVSMLILPLCILVGVMINSFFVHKGWLEASFVVSQVGAYVFATLLILFGFVVVGALAHHIAGISGKSVALLAVILTFVVVLVARIHAEQIRVYDIQLESSKVSREYHFVQLSDIHRGSTGARHLERITNKVAELDPDFVVITGDFIDREYVTSESIVAFKKLSMPVFLITGNHEYYLKEGKINEVIVESNILLIDDMKVSYDEIDVVGVNELKSIQLSVQEIGGINNERFNIILYHQPKTHEAQSASTLGADMMLSGHTHKGQVWPLGLLIQKFQFKYLAGLYQLGDMSLYVNQGTGTWGPKMRLGSVNEITHFTITKTE